MIFLIFILTNNQYEQKSYTYTELNFDYEQYDLTQEQAVELCSSLVGSYKIVWNNDVHYSGLAVIPLRYCFINKYQTGWQLLETLTHEFVHLKYWAVNETFTQFMTFKLLYESDNEILHNKGKEIAIRQNNHEYYKPYECSWYVNKYFRECI